jgi:3'-phosphoadenosine 5'-phosphosulfate (PAPS) 3'-phosphatase
MTAALPVVEAAIATGRWGVELAAAVELVQSAGRLVAARYEDSGPVAYKGARDIVTEVDHAAEALIRAGIAERFPIDAFYGEESGRDATVAARVWVCDPVDGTINYANGLPFFCVSLALVADGRPVVRSGGRRSRPPPMARRRSTIARSARRPRNGCPTW